MTRMMEHLRCPTLLVLAEQTGMSYQSIRYWNMEGRVPTLLTQHADTRVRDAARRARDALRAIERRKERIRGGR